MDRVLSNSEKVTRLQGVPFNRQIVTRMELAEVCENIEEVLSPFHRENRINQEIPRDYEMGTWRENTEGDSVNFSRTRQKNDRKSGKEEEKRVLRAFGTVIESPIGSALEESWKIATADTLGGKETAHIQTCQRTPEVRSCAAVGPPKEPLPGRLVNRLSEWKKIGGDKLVSRGIRARWKSPQSPISLEERRHRQEFRGTTETMNSYLSLLEEELKDEVVKPIHESEVKWFNPTFMVRMKNGKWRKILDCRALNEEVQGKHFKMDSQKTVVELLEENDWMTTLDILSEYQHVKVDEQFSPFLYFSFQSQCYANVGMPFGAKDAPRVFTKIMRRAASNIREHWKVKLVIYLDDILIMHPDRDALRSISQEIAQFLRNLGWILSEEKLKLEPARSVEFLGWLWNSEKMEVTLQERKRVLLLEDVRKWIAHAKKRRIQKTRDLAALLGRLNFVRLQHPPASLWMKRMQYVLRHAIARGGWNGTVIPNPMMLGELTHWRKTLRENRPRSLRRRNRPAELTTDASELGWGAVLTIPTENKEEKIYVHGSWTLQESTLAINEKESRAVLRTLERKGAWLKEQEIDHICLRTDNMSTRWTIQKKRGALSLIPTLRALEKNLNSLDITILTEHLPGELNTKADALSRMERNQDYALRGKKVAEILQLVAPRTLDIISESIAPVPCGCAWRLYSLRR